MKKWSIEKMSDFWSLWEQYAGESFMDCFVSDNIYNMGIVIGYFYGKFPELGRYILEASDYKVPWKFIMDSPYRDGNFLPGIDALVEAFYDVENEDGVYNDENYDKVIYVWCSLIHDIDIYYSRFIKWIDKNEISDVTKELNKRWEK